MAPKCQMSKLSYRFTAAIFANNNKHVFFFFFLKMISGFMFSEIDFISFVVVLTLRAMHF